MWANHVRFVDAVLCLITLAVAFIPAMPRRMVGILTMAAGAITVLLCGVIGGTGPGLKSYVGIVIAGAILFGCGAIAVAVTGKKK